MFGQPRLAQDEPETKRMQLLSGQRVLVVDDHLSYLALWAELLKALGARASLARSASEALIFLRSEQFALIVVDQHLTDSECYGSDLARMVRDGRTFQAQDTPVLACTSDTTAATQKKFASAGVDAVLGKPLDTSAILTALRAVFHFSS